ncbi:MAG TPA: hypothetical protein VK660_07190 [Xanthomonadaceae bacterium]|jgi:hypothetical protein|nr:hypothetical protein [Xanthomonadaceae bacterium]
MDGPTNERLAHAEGFLNMSGRSKSSRRITMYDDPLGRAWLRHRITAAEYSALGRYAYHWASGGLLSALQSVDLNRILAFNPASMSGLAKSEAQADHRSLYHRARAHIGRRPALVADGVACFEFPIIEIAARLGYRSAAHGRIAAYEILSDAGYRLAQFWKEADR